jgi:hypothetical protein
MDNSPQIKPILDRRQTKVLAMKRCGRSFRLASIRVLWNLLEALADQLLRISIL